MGIKNTGRYKGWEGRWEETTLVGNEEGRKERMEGR